MRDRRSGTEGTNTLYVGWLIFYGDFKIQADLGGFCKYILVNNQKIKYSSCSFFHKSKCILYKVFVVGMHSLKKVVLKLISRLVNVSNLH